MVCPWPLNSQGPLNGRGLCVFQDVGESVQLSGLDVAAEEGSSHLGGSVASYLSGCGFTGDGGVPIPSLERGLQ